MGPPRHLPRGRRRAALAGPAAEAVTKKSEVEVETRGDAVPAPAVAGAAAGRIETKVAGALAADGAAPAVAAAAHRRGALAPALPLEATVAVVHALVAVKASLMEEEEELGNRCRTSRRPVALHLRASQL